MAISGSSVARSGTERAFARWSTTPNSRWAVSDTGCAAANTSNRRRRGGCGPRPQRFTFNCSRASGGTGEPVACGGPSVDAVGVHPSTPLDAGHRRLRVLRQVPSQAVVLPVLRVVTGQHLHQGQALVSAEEPADIVIIGSGFGGAVAACRLVPPGAKSGGARTRARLVGAKTGDAARSPRLLLLQQDAAPAQRLAGICVSSIRWWWRPGRVSVAAR